MDKKLCHAVNLDAVEFRERKRIWLNIGGKVASWHSTSETGNANHTPSSGVKNPVFEPMYGNIHMHGRRHTP